MNKYIVTLAVSVPAYAEIEIEAESQVAAEQAVAKELDECGDEFASRFWHDPTFEPDWQQAEDFRIVEGYFGAWETIKLLKKAIQ
jgi:hypothetical protein